MYLPCPPKNLALYSLESNALLPPQLLKLSSESHFLFSAPFFPEFYGTWN